MTLSRKTFVAFEMKLNTCIEAVHKVLCAMKSSYILRDIACAYKHVFACSYCGKMWR